MANYPNFQQLSGSEIVEDDNQILSTSVSGKTRIRQQYNYTNRRFLLMHYLTVAEFTTLINFYTANKRTSFNLTWQMDETVYSCFFSAIPKRKPQVSGFYMVDVSLVQVL